MTRTLPWLATSDSTSKAGTFPKESRSERPKTPKTHDIPFNSSPPPVFSPTKDTMHKKDEAWIMVEDELLSTAQTFTRSLHINEDRKRRSLAQRRAAETLNKIDRPIDPRAKMSSELRMKKSHEIQEARTQKGMNDIEDRSAKRRRVTNDSDSDSDVPIGDRNLAGLMQGSREQRIERKPLDSFVGSLQTNTRAATGHNSQLSPKAMLKPAPERQMTKKPVQKETSTRPYESPPSTPDRSSFQSHKSRRHASPVRLPEQSKPPRAKDPPKLEARPERGAEIRDKALTPDDSDEDRPKTRVVRRTLGKKKVDTAGTPTPAKLDLDEIPFFDV